MYYRCLKCRLIQKAIQALALIEVLTYWRGILRFRIEAFLPLRWDIIARFFLQCAACFVDIAEQSIRSLYHSHHTLYPGDG